MPPKTTLKDTLAQWYAKHPSTPSQGGLVGYRKCLIPECPTQIEESQTRLHCYFHGGKPTVRARRSRLLVQDLDRIQRDEMRRARFRETEWVD